MKKLLFITLAVVALFGSCKKSENENPQPSAPTPMVTTHPITIKLVCNDPDSRLRFNGGFYFSEWDSTTSYNLMIFSYENAMNNVEYTFNMNVGDSICLTSGTLYPPHYGGSSNPDSTIQMGTTVPSTIIIKEGSTILYQYESWIYSPTHHLNWFTYKQN